MPQNKKRTVTKRSSTALRLVQAAVLAAVLVPLGSVAIESSTIYCDTGYGACSGTFSPTNTSNTWKFTDSIDGLLYTFTLSGQVSTAFTIAVDDRLTTQSAELANLAAFFGNSVCVPTRNPGSCGIFDVFGSDGFVSGLYDLEIAWFSNSDPLSQPQNAYILQSKNGFHPIWTNQLTAGFYFPNPTPTDPVVGGKGDSFSTFGVFTDNPIPEPTSLLLLGTGLGAAWYKRARRKRQSRNGPPPVS